MHVQNLFLIFERAIEKSINKLKQDLLSIRTGIANKAIVENIKVKSFNSIVSIGQIASINILNAKTIEISPWNVSYIFDIEKAILKSDVGITPIVDGKLIRLSIPTITEHRRKEIVKIVNKISEKFKISIRNERRILNENIKKFKKNRLITEDDKKNLEIKAQKLTDIYILKIDELIEKKKKEIMQI
jgi:ribosome recycling factor